MTGTGEDSSTGSLMQPDASLQLRPSAALAHGPGQQAEGAGSMTRHSLSGPAPAAVTAPDIQGGSVAGTTAGMSSTGDSIAPVLGQPGLSQGLLEAQQQEQQQQEAPSGVVAEEPAGRQVQGPPRAAGALPRWGSRTLTQSMSLLPPASSPAAAARVSGDVLVNRLSHPGSGVWVGSIISPLPVAPLLETGLAVGTAQGGANVSELQAPCKANYVHTGMRYEGLCAWCMPSVTPCSEKLARGKKNRCNSTVA